MAFHIKGLRNMAIVGLPNVGKSTLFNALTQAGIEAANFPFCTIEPNTGTVPLPDPRLDQLAAIAKPQRVIPTTMEFVDVAGLVKGAAQGEGLGNQFLANIRETDAIGHVVRCFDDEQVVHVDGGVAPSRDIEVINMELALADFDACERAITRASKKAKGGDKEAKALLSMLEKIQPHLAEGKMLGELKLSDDELDILAPLNFLTVKPIMYIANVSEDGFTNNPYLQEVERIAQTQNAVVVPVCAAIEAEIAQLDDGEKNDFLAEMSLSEPGLNRVIRAGHQLLSLQTYFTAGEKEVRAWTIPVGATAPQAAGKIHTDFEKGFIRAEVIRFNDYITYAGEQGAKENGKWRLEGKDYVVNDGDVIHFRFNV